MVNERIYYVCSKLASLPLSPFYTCSVIIVCVYVEVCIFKAHVRGHVWGLGLSFYYVCPNDQTQFVKLGGKHLIPLSHLAGPLKITYLCIAGLGIQCYTHTKQVFSALLFLLLLLCLVLFSIYSCA